MPFSVSIVSMRAMLALAWARSARATESVLRAMLCATWGIWLMCPPAQAQDTSALAASSAAVLPRYTAPTDKFSYAPKEQTRLTITVAAASDVNPDEKGRGAPILVRVYELRSPAIFESADYFSLQSNDKTVLGDDLLVREEFIMRPGDAIKIQRMSHPDIGAIALLAGYRELAKSDWRAIQKVAPAPEAAWYRFLVPSNKAKLQIQIQTSGVRVTPVD